jgi:hypothetical protein
LLLAAGTEIDSFIIYLMDLYFHILDHGVFVSLMINFYEFLIFINIFSNLLLIFGFLFLFVSN